MSALPNGTNSNGEKLSDGSLSTLSIDDSHASAENLSKMSFSSRAIHADDYLNDGQDVAPPLHVSTTFRYSRNPDKLVALAHATVRFSSHPAIRILTIS
jgi:hypothetical protein